MRQRKHLDGIHTCFLPLWIEPLTLLTFAEFLFPVQWRNDLWEKEEHKSFRLVTLWFIIISNALEKPQIKLKLLKVVAQTKEE